MSDVKYERIQMENDIHAQNDDFDNEIKIEHHPVKKRPLNFGIIQAATGTLGLILFYFALSIGLTFYQRWFLKVINY